MVMCTRVGSICQPWVHMIHQKRSANNTVMNISPQKVLLVCVSASTMLKLVPYNLVSWKHFTLVAGNNIGAAKACVASNANIKCYTSYFVNSSLITTPNTMSFDGVFRLISECFISFKIYFLLPVKYFSWAYHLFQILFVERETSSILLGTQICLLYDDQRHLITSLSTLSDCYAQNDFILQIVLDCDIKFSRNGSALRIERRS